MGLIAPKARKHLSADALFGLLRNGFAKVPDHRSDGTEITLPDALMSGFAMFSLKCPSLLDYDKQRAEDNLQTIYGIQRVPCDTTLREILDPLSPEALRASFRSVFRQLQRGKALEEMVFFQDCYLLALDGTGYFSSKKVHCQSCLEKHHRDGSISYSHQMLGAALIHPDRREVIPLMPEPIVKQDGTEKNDCERTAAKRFIAKLRQDHPHLKFIVTEDGLSSNAPHIETLHDYECHSTPITEMREPRQVETGLNYAAWGSSGSSDCPRSAGTVSPLGTGRSSGPSQAVTLPEGRAVRGAGCCFSSAAWVIWSGVAWVMVGTPMGVRRFFRG